jgi:hypothetical protein
MIEGKETKERKKEKLGVLLYSVLSYCRSHFAYCGDVLLLIHSLIEHAKEHSRNTHTRHVLHCCIDLVVMVLVTKRE